MPSGEYIARACTDTPDPGGDHYPVPDQAQVREKDERLAQHTGPFQQFDRCATTLTR
ncbi:hypothetical protein MANAM107_09320 [Actinomyces capricornis]|uniref:Uncharacterized protein n=1 Tax=Actinomyces capricornis TaxID=2755559 RepID=A0ABM7U9L9_9ACTO|nr:hypothetical protein MANAM107_09320 [Actinomyces capricornis]